MPDERPMPKPKKPDPALPNEAGLLPSDICRAFRVPHWVALGGRRPTWPVRAWYWLRGYRSGAQRDGEDGAR